MKRVLVVEDDDDLRDVLSLAFATINGWDVSSASNADEALLILAASRPRLVLCDLHLGKTLATNVIGAAVRMGVPTVVLTASRNGIDVARHVGVGVSAILEKPIDPYALCDLGRELAAASDSQEADVVTAFIAERRPRVASEAFTLLGDDSPVTRQGMHRLLGRLATYGLDGPAADLREAEESMAAGLPGHSPAVRASVERARSGLADAMTSDPAVAST